MTFKSDQDPDPHWDKMLDPDPRINNTVFFCCRCNPVIFLPLPSCHSSSLFSLCAAGIGYSSYQGEGVLIPTTAKKDCLRFLFLFFIQDFFPIMKTLYILFLLFVSYSWVFYEGKKTIK